MVKKIGGIMFLVGSIASMLLAAIMKNNAPVYVMEVFYVVGVVGAFMTGSKGIIVYLVGCVATYVGAKGFIPNEMASTCLLWGGLAVSIVGVVLIWKDSIKDIFKK